MKERIVMFIQENELIFPKIMTFLNKMPIETKKLILVEVYCFLGEFFNFNINEFYCEAFSIIGKNKCSKRVKK